MKTEWRSGRVDCQVLQKFIERDEFIFNGFVNLEPVQPPENECKLNIPVVNALDTYFGEFRGDIGGYAIFSNHSYIGQRLPSGEGCRVMY